MTNHRAPNAVELQNFHKAMVAVYQNAVRETDYKPTKFLQMVSEQGGYETAIALIHSAKPSDGYTQLWQRGRLDLTVEALVLSKEWQEIFTVTDLQAAYMRLKEYEFQFTLEMWKPTPP